MDEQKTIFTKEELDSSFFKIHLSLIEYAANHTLEELLTRAVDEVGAIVASPIGFYHFVEPDQKNLSLQCWSTRTLEKFCRTEAKTTHYPIAQAGVWVDCVHQKKAVIHNDYAALPHKKGLPEGHADVIRQLVVPVFRKDKIVAILGVGNKPTEYTPKDLEVVSYLADVTWEIVLRKQTGETLHRASHALNERVVKELNCLYGISKLVEEDYALEEILQSTVELIPPSWQYPEATCAQIKLNDQCYRSDNFRETKWLLAKELIVHGEQAGTVEVYYLEEKPESDEGVFLAEERTLINTIAERMGHIIETRLAERKIEENRKQLQDAFDRMSRLIQDVIVTENTDLRLENPHLKRCYEEMDCDQEDCPCHGKAPMRCWQVAGTFCGGGKQGTHAQKHRSCQMCQVFKDAAIDPVGRIGEHFNNMMHILKNKQEELQQALNEIKTLQGIVPICSHCKQIRDDQGFWNRVDSYIEQHTEARFTHGVCPACQKKHYAQFLKKE